MSNVPHLSVAPVDGLIDGPLEIRVSGLAPGIQTRLRATVLDDLSRRWTSEATFIADAGGSVDVTRDAPTAGTYVERDPTGLLWSMQVDTAETRIAPFRKWSASGLEVEVELAVEGRVLARRPVRRHCALTGSGHPVRDRGLVASYFAPERPAGRGAVAIFGGSNGAFLESMAALLASHGIGALAVAYFGREHLPAGLVEIPVEIGVAALDYLLARGDVDSVGLVGVSKGAELALLLASHDRRVSAVVAYGPSAHVFSGVSSIDDLDRAGDRSSWALGGEPLPYLVVPAMRSNEPPSNEAPTVVAPRYHEALDRAAEHDIQAAAIPVERIRGAVLLVSGEDDHVWPAAQFGQLVIDRLAEHRHGCPYEHIVYQKAGHSLSFPCLPTTSLVASLGGRRYSTGGTPQDNAHAHRDSWPRALRFLADNLRPPRAGH